ERFVSCRALQKGRLYPICTTIGSTCDGRARDDPAMDRKARSAGPRSAIVTRRFQNLHALKRCRVRRDAMADMNRREFGRSGIAGLAGIAFGRDPERSGDPERVALHAQSIDGRAYRYVHLDVFTDRRLQGNQLFVFVQPGGLDTDAMQTMTRESNLSENTFVFPPEQPGTDHRVRIFTRTAETPFAGHPTIGTAFALAHTGVLKPGLSHTTFGLGVGPTNVDLEWKDGRLAFAWMTQLKPTFGKAIADGGAVAAAIGLTPDQVRLKADATPGQDSRGVRLQPDLPAGQEVNCGSNFFIVPLATRKAVDAAVLDRAKV